MSFFSYIRRSRPTRPAIDAMLMIFPCPCRAIRRAAAWQQKSEPVRLVAISFSMSSGVRSKRWQGPPPEPPPALFTRMSSLPCQSYAFGTTSATCAASLTSSARGNTCTPHPARNRSAAVSTLSRLRDVITRSVPASASASAMSYPRFRAPPVSSATRPFSLKASNVSIRSIPS